MTKQQLLLVDGDPRTLHVLEASLRSAGFAVMTAGNGQAALARCRVSPPDLVVSDTAIPGMDGFQLCQAIKNDELLKDTPIVFLSGSGTVEEKVRGLELGAEDYLTKPIDTREFVTRMRVLVEKREKERFNRRQQRATFSGSLDDLSIAELLQTLEVGRKTGTVHIEASDGRTATLWLKEGAVIDAVAGHRRGEPAFHWFLKWRGGRFSIQFGPVDRPLRIETPTQHLLMDGMRRLDEWPQALAQLPACDCVLQLDYRLLSERLADIPDQLNAVLKLVDGRRTIAQLLDETEEDDLEVVSAIQGLLREELVRVRAAPSSTPPALPRSRPGLGTAPRVPPAGLDELSAARDPAQGAPSIASAVAAAARDAARERGPRAPRIVRFASQPRMAVEVPPVATGGRQEGAGPDPSPVTERAPPVAPAPLAAGEEPRPRRADGMGALLVLVLVLAAGFVAWRLARGEPGAPAQRATAATSRVADGYAEALEEARREQAAARFAEAVSAYRRAASVRTTSEAYEGLGRALRGTGDAPGAVEALRRAIELDPANAAAYIAVARIHVEARRVEEARSAYQRYLSLEPQGRHAGEARAAIGVAP